MSGGGREQAASFYDMYTKYTGHRALGCRP